MDTRTRSTERNTIGGSAHNHAFAPPNGDDWVFTGSATSFHVHENTNATAFNGDQTNEQVSTQEQIGDTTT